jgi:transposase
VLSLPPSVRLFMATQAVDGRKGVDSLMVLVRDVLKQDPLSGHLFIFFSRRCDRVRVVYWDRNGFAMWTLSSDLHRRPARCDCDQGRTARAHRRGNRLGGRAPSAAMAARTFVTFAHESVNPSVRCFVE